MTMPLPVLADASPDAPPLHLVAPSGTDVLAAALAWFDGAHWLLSPDDARVQTLPVVAVGARFRGSRAEAPVVVPRLELAPGAVVEGPLAPGGVAAATAVAHAGLRPEVETYRVPGDPTSAAWATAAARHCGGAVVTSSHVLAPGAHDVLVRLTLYSPLPSDLDTVARLVRAVLPLAEPVAVRGRPGAAAMRHDLDYDGAVVVQPGEAGGTMPPALRAADWRHVGPHTCTVTWQPPLPDDDGTAPLDLLALRRAAPWLLRTLRALRDGLGGTVLDAEGFVVDDAALAALASGR